LFVCFCYSAFVGLSSMVVHNQLSSNFVTQLHILFTCCFTICFLFRVPFLFSSAYHLVMFAFSLFPSF
jgi:hypothetical protein